MGSVGIIKASAGTGKTYRLVYEYIGALIADPQAYRSILAVTFTNKATAEMKERIIKELHAMASGAPSRYIEGFMRDTGLDEAKIREKARLAQSNILHDYSHFWVLTIDKFFQNIIRLFLRELGFPLDFNLELRTDPILDQAADFLIEQAAEDPALEAWIAAFAGEQQDSGAAWDIRRKLAGAGKTIFTEEWDVANSDSQAGLLRERLAQMISAVAEQEAKAIALMQSVANEAMEIIDNACLATEDFSYKASGPAGYFKKTASGEIDGYNSYVARALDGDNGWFPKGSPQESAITALIPALQPLLVKLCGLWDTNHALFNSAQLLRKRFRTHGLLGDMARMVSQLCTEQNIMPIAQTNKILRSLIEGNDVPFIFEKAGNHFTRFLIDEFQDTSRGQWENFVPLLRNATAQSSGVPVTLVGDVKQSIYRWRGGDWQILASDAAARMGDVREEMLDTNRRSLPQVVGFNNAAIAACVENDTVNMNRVLGKAFEDGYIGAELRDELLAMLPSAYYGHEQKLAPGKEGGYVTVTTTLPPAVSMESAREPIDPVIERVEDLQRRGYRPDEIMILVRRRKEATQISRMLLARKASGQGQYCYDVVTEEALRIGSSPTVDFIAACMSMAVNPSDAVGRAQWSFGMGLPFDAPPSDEDAGFLASLALLPVQEAFQRVILRYANRIAEDQTAYVQAFHEQILRFTASNVADMPLFLEWWREEGHSEAVYMPANRSAIRVITIHKAKGLESKAVILPYCSWELIHKSTGRKKHTFWATAGSASTGDIPRLQVDFENAAAESWFSHEYYTELALSHIDNINLLYVALTRAGEELHIFAPKRTAKSKSTALPCDTVGDLLTAAIKVDGGHASIGKMPGNLTTDTEAVTTVEFGTPVTPARSADPEEAKISTGYPTRDPGLRIRLRLPSLRYFSEGETPAGLSPRSFGVLMHKAFENASTAEDIYLSLTRMRSDGLLSQAEAAEIEGKIRAALVDPLINSWFSPQWTQVRNENDIVVPRSSARRPDRVMIREGTAVVVDYKFGHNKDPKYGRQIAQYKKLLEEMGYTATEGYIWYVSIGEIEKI